MTATALQLAQFHFKMRDRATDELERLIVITEKDARLFLCLRLAIIVHHNKAHNWLENVSDRTSEASR